MLAVYWITGGNPNGNSASTNAGTTGQLNNIPLTGMPLRIGAVHRPAAQRQRPQHVAAAVEN